MTPTHKLILSQLLAKKDNKQAEILQSFFKTAKGQYGYGDIFLGIKVPIQRSIAKKFIDLPLSEIQKIIISKFHECRLTALLILNYKYPKADKKQQKEIYDFFLKNISYINNWDLVDISSPNILGQYLLNHSRRPLYNLAKSKNLWHRRIAIISTLAFIRNMEFEDTIKLAKFLLDDKEDLIRKAVGWMLREVGKRNQKILLDFIIKNKTNMSRVTYRYAIEKLDKSLLSGLQ
jgi:3-methyladenine DNA glycosylase AlkD